MPTLQFKGKNIIWNHHLSIPYHALDEVEELHYKPEKANGNIIIEGDNLLALKALLPQYSGRIKCIYIDPPYNTGNEHWIYNDNVNSPLMREWLGKEVGTDCLARHDKWLCMMVPRLKLLRDLLSDEGIICISIDDNEFNNLISICNEIFSDENRFGIIIVENNPRGRRLGTEIAIEHEYLVIYAKNINKFKAGRLPLTEEQAAEYSKKDENGKRYRLLGLRKRGALSKRTDRPNLHFPIYVNPDDETIHLEKGKDYVTIIPKLSDGTEGVWRWSKKKVIEEINSLKAMIVTRRDTGEKEWDIFEIDYLENENGDINGRLFPSIWQGSEFNNETGKDQIKDLFDNAVFDYPKPVDLIKHAILLSNDKNALILDSFAGSGTTAQAIVELNNSDNGKRSFILVQMTEATEAEPKKNICKDITRERIKRAIDKYGYDSGFKYFRVGIPIDAESLLSGKLPTFKQFAEYVYYLCTGEHIKDKSAINEKTYLVGTINNSVIYLVYKQNFDELTRLALNLPLAEKIIADNPRKKIIVYAPACFLEEDYMKDNNIEFVGIPYNLFRRENGA